MNNSIIIYVLPLIIGWIADLALGDPVWLPHPIVLFGKMIAIGERILNKGVHRMLKGAVLSIILIASTYIATSALLHFASSLNTVADICFRTIIIFYCLAGTTLIKEVRHTFHSIDHSLAEGRQQVARIVGRDTTSLSAQEIRTAALETLAENLSDGIIAPLFWLAIGGIPCMLTYKMVNTLDSMIGYRTKRYMDFGCIAARIDDIANYIPARITAFMMIFVSGHPSLMRFVITQGTHHASPNSGFPEAALAGILNCRFGGPHYYHGELFDKPFIGENDRALTTADMEKAVKINRVVEILSIMILVTIYCI